ncbi:MAG: 3'(2'),5'-bisphosphate nucleotidase CysQ, partial [Balneolaceae bacterium]|nr:3'(2'),5'-bisphosphate nucleotidase CysQ [Balneolaceae bacterium]
MLEQIKAIAIEAGEAILTFYNDDISFNRKDDNSPLTKADLAAHKIIVKGLKELAPGIPIISEESEIPDYETRKNWTMFFLVDPLDGTKEFIKKNGEFTVNIALIEGDSPVLGVVYIPAQDRLYFADKESGAWLQNGADRAFKISHTPYDKSKPARIAVSRSHGGSDTIERLAKLGIEVSEEIPYGSSLKICLVAEGKADIYPRFGPTMEWDTAA